MLPGAAWDQRESRGGVRRSQRFSEERQMKADGAKSQSSIPQPSLGDRPGYAGLSMWADCQYICVPGKYHQPGHRVEPCFRGGGQVCL